MQRHNATLYTVASKRFGGWRQAITAAGLDYATVRVQAPQRTWSKNAVKEEILRRHREGLTLSASEVQKEHQTLIWAATKYFGSGGWRKALTYAGLDYREFDTRILWSKQSVVETIKQRKEQRLPLNVGSLKTPELRSLLSGAERVFGSWEAAITAAGLDYAYIRLNEGWDSKRVVNLIRGLRRINVWLNSYYVQQHHPHLFSAARRHFGSWPVAVLIEKALDQTQKLGKMLWTPELVIEVIRSRHRQGLPLDNKAVNGTPLQNAAYNRFGGWRQAVEAAGIEYPHAEKVTRKGGQWTTELVIETIKRMHENSEPLNHRDVKETTIYRASRTFFGTWRKALAAAGLNYPQLPTKWSKDAVVAEIKRRHALGLWLGGGKETWNLRAIARYYFGERGWRKALLAAGLQPRESGGRYSWSRTQFVEMIQQRHRDELPLNVAAMQKSRFTHAFMQAAYKEFGSWAAAIEAAGLDYSAIRIIAPKWTRQAILQKIKDLVTARTPINATAVGKSHSGLYEAAQREFGSWDKATAAAGVAFAYTKYARPEKDKVRYPVEWVRLPGHLVSLNEPLRGEPDLTRENFLGETHLGFEQVEARQTLLALLKQDRLKSDMVELLERIIMGNDLEDDEYELLASAIREHPELIKLLDTN
ncbi:MAG: hypothetical protein AAB790_01550 [Patescibacteria group bacterium]